MTRRGVFLMNCEVFGYVVKHCLDYCLMYLVNRNYLKTLTGENGEIKS